MATEIIKTKWLNCARIVMPNGEVRPIDQFYIVDSDGKTVTKFRWFNGDNGTNNPYDKIVFDFVPKTVKKDVNHGAPFVTSKLVAPVFGSSHKTLGEPRAVDVYLPADWFTITEEVQYVTEKGEAAISHRIVLKLNPEVFAIVHARFEMGWI